MLRQRINVAEMQSISETYKFLKRGELLADPEATPYARWWREADPGSFRRKI